MEDNPERDDRREDRPRTDRRSLVIGAIAGSLHRPGLKTAFDEEKYMASTDTARREAQRVYHEWHAGFRERNIDRVVALYTENAIIETPAILSVYPENDEGILVGREKSSFYSIAAWPR